MLPSTLPAPVRPVPPTGDPSALALLRLARRDLLAISSEETYRLEFFGRKPLRVLPEMGKLTAEIIGRTMFGDRIETL
jgi:hypothetical protein